MRVGVDRERCCSAGMCVLTAPEVFDQDEVDGRVMLLLDPVPAERVAEAREAVSFCPSGALRVVES
ncbi:ferredoxin [Streptomyces chumphonensis]|uniref:Ferredoxin n=1 Tax=Streptomyces chumphonensis TaxID=1214925 RepID=A0A927F3Q0_9ACTN|nr:ferredoxin [Streptomyces chumphonensis]MBD3934975.1 ferredoxin [Streptomyces chumphonensis]